MEVFKVSLTFDFNALAKIMFFLISCLINNFLLNVLCEISFSVGYTYGCFYELLCYHYT